MNGEKPNFPRSRLSLAGQLPDPSTKPSSSAGQLATAEDSTGELSSTSRNRRAVVLPFKPKNQQAVQDPLNSGPKRWHGRSLRHVQEFITRGEDVKLVDVALPDTIKMYQPPSGSSAALQREPPGVAFNRTLSLSSIRSDRTDKPSAKVSSYLSSAGVEVTGSTAEAVSQKARGSNEGRGGARGRGRGGTRGGGQGRRRRRRGSAGRGRGLQRTSAAGKESVNGEFLRNARSGKRLTAQRGGTRAARRGTGGKRGEQKKNAQEQEAKKAQKRLVDNLKTCFRLLGAQDVEGFVRQYNKSFETTITHQPGTASRSRNYRAKARFIGQSPRSENVIISFFFRSTAVLKLLFFFTCLIQRFGVSRIPLLQMVICRNSLEVLQTLMAGGVENDAKCAETEKKIQDASAVLPDFCSLVNETWDNGVTPLMCVRSTIALLCCVFKF